MRPDEFEQIEMAGFLPFLAALRAVKRPVSTAPTATPKNLLDQFAIYENGATRRLYVYVGGTWRYTALT
jgi:hypothetical protein